VSLSAPSGTAGVPLAGVIGRRPGDATTTAPHGTGGTGSVSVAGIDPDTPGGIGGVPPVTVTAQKITRTIATPPLKVVEATQALAYEAVLLSRVPNPNGPQSLAEVCGLTFTSLNLEKVLGDDGLCTLSCIVDTVETVGRERLRDLKAAPCELWVRRTENGITQKVHAGPVTALEINDRTLTLTSPGLRYYMRYWFRETDFAATGQDQSAIVRQLLDDYQAQPYSNMGLDTSVLPSTGIARDLALAGRDQKGLVDVFSEMGNRDNGFDLEVDPETRQVRLWSPLKGSDLSGSVIIDRRVIGSPKVSATVAAGVVATTVVGTGASTETASLSATVEDATGLAQFGRATVPMTYSDVSDPVTLHDNVSYQLGIMSPQQLSVSPELMPVAEFGYGAFDTGDFVTYDYDAGLGDQTAKLRVQRININVDGGREKLEVAFL
jgi:hypothetical protein